MTEETRKKSGWRGFGLALCLGAVAIPGLGWDWRGGAAMAQSPELPSGLLDAARDYAATLTGGEKIGGTVHILGVNGGYELEILKAAWKPFEEATGITVDYAATTDFIAVLQTRVDAGDPPDVVGSTNINNLLRFAGAGKLQDLGEMIGRDKFEGHFDPGMLQAASYDGKIYGVWTEIHNFMIWYNNHTYDGPKDSPTWEEFEAWAEKRASEGNPPWCYTDERGASTGYSGLQWISTYILRNFGPEVFTGLTNGTHPWNSDEVKQAFEAFGKMVHDDRMLQGGAIGAMSTPAVRLNEGMFSDPARCSVSLWATYTAGLTMNIYPEVKPIEDLNFMPVPGKPEFANYQNFQGTIYLAFKDSPQIKAFMTYLASEYQQRLVAASGNWAVANQAIKPADYPNPIITQVSEMFLKPGITLLPQPNQIIDPPITQAFLKAVIQYAVDPESLPELLDAIEDAKH